MSATEYEKYTKIEDLPIVTKVYHPDENTARKGAIQFVHGMCETKERYQRVIKYFTDRGFVCVISDSRGHGENVEFEKDLGYIGDDGANLLVEDVHAVTIFIKNIYPDLPITLLGHSMGSLLVRAYVKKYDNDIDFLVVMGSPSIRFFRHFGLGFIEFVSLFKDEHEKDSFINHFMVGSYSKKFASENVPNSWICSDMKVVEAYNNMPKCGFMFTLNGHKTLCKLQIMVYSKKNWKMNNKNLRIFFVSGEDDPCMISEEVFDKSVNVMRKVGYKKVESKLYKGMRHEILNEQGYIEVLEDILKRLPVA